jgi:thiol-disulfide isomerase/thioredoxin
MRCLGALLLTVALANCADTAKADLTLKDAGGRRVRLRDFRGKPVVLNFWATWCVPCNVEMPMLVDLEKQYAARDIAFIGASLDDAKTKSNIPEFVSKHHIAFPVWYGATADDLDQLKLGGAVPATVFLDSEGRVVARILGQARLEELRERLEWLLGDHTGTPPESLVRHLDK